MFPEFTARLRGYNIEDGQTEVPNMMWNYVQFPDETQVAYSDVQEDGTVRIDIERPRDWGL